MIRLFTGLSIPKNAADKIHALQGGIPGARWTESYNYHITLNFIGGVDEATAEDIDDILSTIHHPAFDLKPQGIGSFSQGEDPRVLWVGLAPEPALNHLQEKIYQVLTREKIALEKRKYTPHITLARFRQPDETRIIQFMQDHSSFEVPAFHVPAFHVYQSSAGKSGPLYQVLRSYPLF